MIRWLGILIGTLRSAVRTHRELALENLALRQELVVWKARQPRPPLTALDPDLLVRSVEALEELAELAACRAACDSAGMAPAGVQALLVVEESTRFDGCGLLARRGW